MSVVNIYCCSHKYNYVADKEGDYDLKDCEATVLAIYKGGQTRALVDNADCDDMVTVILDKTSMYAEAGGQIADTGLIVSSPTGEMEFEVKQVQARQGYIAHVGSVLSGKIQVGDSVKTLVNTSRRRPVMSNHTATHLLNFGLRRVLRESNGGESPEQKGSLVAPDRLRFDFSCKNSMTKKELFDCEESVRTVIKEDQEVFAREVPLTNGKSIQGLRAVFDETYPDPVRVVSVGVPIDTLLNDPTGPEGLQHSVEFCGGTHLLRSSHIGEFAIVSEDAIQRGVRRIQAVTGSDAENARENWFEFEKKVKEFEKDMSEFLTANNVPGQKLLSKKSAELVEKSAKTALLPAWARDEIRERMQAVKQKLDAAEKERRTQALASAKKEIQDFIAKLSDKDKKDTKGFVIKYLAPAFAGGLDSKALDALLKEMTGALKKCAILLIATECESNVFPSKVLMASAVPKDMSTSFSAADWVKGATAQLENARSGGIQLTQWPLYFLI